MGRAARVDLTASTAIQAALRSAEGPKRVFASNDNIEVLDHELVLWHNSDVTIDATDFVERLLGDAQIAKQSELIAKKLEAAGFDPYLRSEDEVSMVGLISGTILPLSKYRNINVIPEIAQRNRLGLIHEFKLFLQENPKHRRYARYMVVTSGPRFPIPEFPERLKDFNARIGRYIQKCKKASIDVLLVAVEFTIDNERTVNLHANLITSPRKAFGRNGWMRWLDRTREHFGQTMIHDAGRVRDPKEIIKYVCKYSEIVTLGASDTAFIAQCLYKRQMVRPVGEFAVWRKALRRDGQKVRYDYLRKSLVRCQVAKRRKRDDEPMDEEDVWEEIAAASREVRIAELARSGKLRQRDGDREPVQNQILCRTLPQCRATLLAEPFVVVVNFNSNPSTRNGREGLEAIEARRRHHFKLLAEDGIEAMDIAPLGASILDTLTIIPTRFSHSYFRLPQKRREKLRKALGLVKLVPSPEAYEHVAGAVSEALERHYPMDRHEWSPDVSDVAKLLREGLEAQEDWEARDEACREAERQWPSARRRFDAMTDEELDDVIPY